MLGKANVLDCREMYVRLKLDLRGEFAAFHSILNVISNLHWTAAL